MGFEQECLQREIIIETADGPSAALVLTPPQERLQHDPLLLLNLAMDRETTLYTEPYNLTARAFLEKGHRAVSIDLPHHGARVREFGEGITSFRNALVQGRDDFALFVESARELIDACVANGLARTGRIAVAGTSRAGYLAMRILGADARIAAGAAFSPVTDWRHLSEFAADAGTNAVAELSLSRYARALAGKRVFCIIGGHDERVSTASCLRFYLDLLDANSACGYGDSHLNFQVHDVPGHCSRDEWYLLAADFLLQAAAAEPVPAAR